MQTAYIIKCNDSGRGVIIGDSKRAEELKNELKGKDYEKKVLEYADIHHYSAIFFWHIEVVPVL